MNDLSNFIYKNIVKRKKSMFSMDVENNKDLLKDKISKKRVLVIGGAGSIGSAYIKEILPYKPIELVVVDINENALAELTRDLRSTHEMYVPIEYVTYPMDYDSPIFERMFRAHGGFDIVANFSAHKHVRSEKDIYSIEALMQNNVLHVRHLLALLEEFPPEEYFCVSTDKAANPASIMGGSKRIMEDLIFSYSDCFPVKTARFANVAFSNGSLPAGFLERMNKLQPISAPSDVKRYFVSPEESGQICMLACMLGDNREIFFPKLQEEQMTTFGDIAVNLLKENGYEPALCDTDQEAIDRSENLKKGSKKYPVHFEPSDTSGEKLYEEFYTDEETVDMKRFQALGVITGKQICDRDKLAKLMDLLEHAFVVGETSKEGIVEIISNYLPNFHHVETGKSLDGKM